MKKIAITTTTFVQLDKSVILSLRKDGFQVKINRLGRKLNKEEVGSFCRGCIGIIAGTEQYDKKNLKLLGGLKVISRCGAGLDNIDLAAAKQLNIKVFNTPNAPTVAVAELALGLIFDLLRQISFSDRKIRRGGWVKPMGNLLCGKNIGIIGFGRIGRKVAELLKEFPVKIGYSDIKAPIGLPGCRKMPLQKLLSWADIISIHANTKKTIIGAKQFNLMKKSAKLINLSRAQAVDEPALCKALETGRISAAALDVFEHEPYKGRLIGFENVILTPHIGSYALESRIDMERQAVDNLVRGLNNL